MGPCDETELNINRFVAARADELSFFMTKCKNKVRTPMQFLPKHLRRRAASSNPRRLPPGFRGQAVRKSKKNKKIRRPRLLEYEKRAQRCRWLETHIWHSKRFHVADKWGWRIPLRHTDKLLRPKFKTVQEKCTIQDLSFYAQLELAGSLEALTGGLAKLCQPGSGLSFNAKCYVSGGMAGSLFVHSPSGDPLGPVTFLWSPGDGDRKVWIFCHPLMLKQLEGAIHSVFEGSGVTVEVIDRLNRFRLTGPLSRDILAAFLAAPISHKHGTDDIRAVLDSFDVLSLTVGDPTKLPKRRRVVPQSSTGCPPWRGACPLAEGTEGGTPIVLFRDVDFQRSGVVVDSWSVVTPRGWGVPFWLNMVFRGARSVGLEEWNSICLDFEWTREVPSLSPDSCFSRLYATQLSQDLRAVHCRRPPSKRINHSKIGFASDPFSCAWDDFFEGGFTLLRDRAKFNQIFGSLQSSVRSRVVVRATQFTQMEAGGSLGESLTLVRVESVGKGRVDAFSEIVLPRIGDIEDEADGVVGEGRLVVGRVAEGTFSRRLGRSLGYGFCLTHRLESLCRCVSPPIALVRSPASQGVYRKVWLTPLMA